MKIGNVLGVYVNSRTRIVGLHQDKKGNYILEVKDMKSVNGKRSELSVDESREILESLKEL